MGLTAPIAPDSILMLNCLISIIYQAIQAEEQYEADLNAVETVRRAEAITEVGRLGLNLSLLAAIH